MSIITSKQYEKFIDEITNELLNPNQIGGAWFNGSKKQFEIWAGDVFCSAIDIIFEKLGIEIMDEDEM